MREMTERIDPDRLETRASIASGMLFHEADNIRAARRFTSPLRVAVPAESLDFGTAENLYGITLHTAAHRELDGKRQTVKTTGLDFTMSRLSNIAQSADNGNGKDENENPPAEETPSQVDSLPENTPASFNVDTPSAGYADEAPESNANSGRGFPDSDPVPTDTQPAPVAMVPAANSHAMNSALNPNNQAEIQSPDPEGMNVEGQAVGTASSNSDDGSNSNASGNDAEGSNGSDGSGNGTDGGGGGDGGSE